jgi:thiamine biosynthesis lipoprotein
MRKTVSAVLVFCFLLLTITGCRTQPAAGKYTRFSDTFMGTFNTVIVVVAYAETEEEFSTYYEMIQVRYQELHKLYDIYNDYDGINNIKTVNDNAGIQPVQVEEDLLDIILMAKEWTLSQDGRTNIALGPVLKIWHDYRIDGIDFPEGAKLPPMELLQEAAKHTDVNQIIIDKQKSTIFLADSRMRLDIGAIAKGYATELVAREVEAAGLKSGAISAGGNIRTIGKPLDGIRDKWGIGIFDPDSTLFSVDRDLDTVFITDASVVSSGDYQRYYFVDGKPYHHLIDPRTLMPATYFRAVTVVTPDSGYADLVSTELFLMPFEEGISLVQSLGNVEALWVMPDGEVKMTEGMKLILRSQGATGQKQ